MFVEAMFNTNEFKLSKNLKAVQEESKEYDRDVMSVERTFGKSIFRFKNYQIA